jgi:hypothetical protein
VSCAFTPWRALPCACCPRLAKFCPACDACLLRLAVHAGHCLPVCQRLLVGEVTLPDRNPIGADTAGRLRQLPGVLRVLLAVKVSHLRANGISKRIEELLRAAGSVKLRRLIVVRLRHALRGDHIAERAIGSVSGAVTLLPFIHRPAQGSCSRVTRL